MSDLPESDQPPSLHQIQENLFHHIFVSKDPPAGDQTLSRRMTRYSIQETLEAVYPLTREAYLADGHSDSDWEQLCEDFFSVCRPLDSRVSWAVENFSEWLPVKPWLKELADYEWAVFEAATGRDPTAEEWLNPTLCLRCYEYPVAAWSESGGTNSKIHLKKPSPSYIVVFRDLGTECICTLEVQQAAFGLLVQWQDGGSPEASVISLAKQLDRSDLEVWNQMKPLLEMLRAQKILLRPITRC